MTYYRNELYHHGIKGQKWGVRRFQNRDGTRTNAGKKRYHSVGIRSKIAKRQNDKVDAGFKNWNENAKKRADAIDLGKKRNLSKIAYEQDSHNRELRNQYRKDNKAYKKALKDNTTYRKGQVKREVGSDLSRKYMSEARKTNKALAADPDNRKLQKQYDRYMSRHDVERAKARRAPEIAANRSRKKASIKRAMTMSVKAAVAAGTVAVGSKAVNSYLNNHDVTFNGQRVNVNPEHIDKINRFVKAGKKMFKYI